MTTQGGAASPPEDKPPATGPRPTKKGYYEPKVVPYPAGKPVYVSGYYRSNGTYVQPHFRSLPGSGSRSR